MLVIAPTVPVEQRIVLIFIAERDAKLLAAILRAEAVALTWDPHDHPSPDMLALPVPATTFANAIDADGGQASFFLLNTEDC